MPRADKLLHLTLTIYNNISNSSAVNSNPNHHNQTMDTRMMKKPSTASANPSTMSATNGPCSKNNNISSSSSSNNKLYKGVRKRKWGKWVSEIRLPNSRERIWLGSYDTQEKAARAFDAALYCLRGRHASFNFPDTPFNINNVAFHGGVSHKHSLSPQEIQEVAAKFANDVPPMELSTQEQEVTSESSQLGAKSNSSNSVTESNSTCAGTLCSAAHVGVEQFDVFDLLTRYTSNGSACPPCRNDGVGQVDYGDLKTMDWTFSDMSDDWNGIACSDYGELLYSSQLYEDNNGDQLEGEDIFSNHSFLWSWNF